MKTSNNFLSQFVRIINNHLVVSEELFRYFDVDPVMLRRLLLDGLKTETPNWKYIAENGKRWIYYDTIPEEFKKEFKLLSEEDLLCDEELRQSLDPELSRRKRMSIFELMVTVQHKNFMAAKTTQDIVIQYFDQGYDSEMIRKIVSTCAVKDIMDKEGNNATTRDFFVALKKLIKNESIPPLLFPLDDSKYFYELIDKLKKFGVEHYLAKLKSRKGNGLLERNPALRNLISGIKMHGGQLSDELVKLIANTVVTALPNIYGNRLLNRQMINRNNNGKGALTIDVGRQGDIFLNEVLCNDINLAETKFPLDRVELDWTRLNIKFRDDAKKSLFFVICAIVDSKTNDILGWSLERSACYEGLRKAFKMMLRRTQNRLPRQIVGDLAGIFKSDEFEVRRKLLEDLNVRVSLTPNPQGKPHVESWFATIIKKYLPLEIGFTGSNKNGSGKRKKIRTDLVLILNSIEYLRTSDQAETLVGRIVHQHNSNNSSPLSSPDIVFHELDKTNAISIPDHVAAFLCYELRQPQFIQNGIKFQDDNKKYSYVLQMDAKSNFETLSKLHGQFVDCYYDRDHKAKAYVFGENSNQYLFEIPLFESVFGNYADLMLDSTRVKKLRKLINQKNALKKEARASARNLLDSIRRDTGVPLKELIKLFYDGRLMGDDHEKLLAKLSYPEVEFDPYSINQLRSSSHKKNGKNPTKPRVKNLNINSTAA